jgi:hypothetical protein
MLSKVSVGEAGEWITVPCILDIDARWGEWPVSRSRRFTLRKEPTVFLEKRLVGPHKRYERKISSFPGNRTRTMWYCTYM